MLPYCAGGRQDVISFFNGGSGESRGAGGSIGRSLILPTTMALYCTHTVSMVSAGVLGVRPAYSWMVPLLNGFCEGLSGICIPSRRRPLGVGRRFLIELKLEELKG